MIEFSDRGESVFGRLRRVYSLISRGDMSERVLDELLPNGVAHEYEKSLWDYKSEIPSLPRDRRPTDDEKLAISCKLSELVKDAVSFHNTYGGYLIIGVSDQPRSIIGYQGSFDCDDFNKRIKGAVGYDINCHFRVLEHSVDGKRVPIGMLFIPQRSDAQPPAQFRNNACANPSGRLAYKKGDIYFRDGSECRPAETNDELSFICAKEKRQYLGPEVVIGTTVLSNNLGARDPGFITFVGREEYLSHLWRWLCDRYTPCKLLSGIGGVGKTTIAREFSEEVTRVAPFGFERVVWLSAKQQLYTAIRGEFRPTARVDFTDVESLLQALLSELGWTKDPETLDAYIKEELIDSAVEALRMTPAFIVVDDLDSLSPELQSDAFQTLIQIAGHTIYEAVAPSRILMTARLELGAAPQQLLKVEGLPYDEFREYVRVTAQTIGLPWVELPKRQLMERFHRETDGSPTFASSVLRLVGLGESLSSVLDQWKGSDGEEVRRFAFERELDTLNDPEVRTLFTICMLGTSSLTELQSITGTSKSLVRDSVTRLRNFHLVTYGAGLPAGEAPVTVPSNIRLMVDIIRKRVRDPKKIEQDCARSRGNINKKPPSIAAAVNHVLSLWKEGEDAEALDRAQYYVERDKGNADLQCLLGRAFLKISPPKVHDADIFLRRAYDGGCRRPELLELWLDAKKLLGDWQGLIEISRIADQRRRSADNVYSRAEAYAELGETARKGGDYQAAADFYRKGALDIDQAFKEGYARGRVSELREMRSAFMHKHVFYIDRLYQDPNYHLEVWLSAADAFDSYVRTPQLIDLGVQRLRSWWRAVENRYSYDERTAATMEQQLYRFDRLIAVLQEQPWAETGLIESLSAVRAELEQRWQGYKNAIREGKPR